MSKAPIETKVIAAAGGAGLGSASGTFILWLLGVLVWGYSPAADKATDAIAAVPQPVAALIVIIVALVGAAIGGYEAPHTPRPDLNQAPADGAADTPMTAPVESSPAAETPAEPEAPAAGVPPADAGPSVA